MLAGQFLIVQDDVRAVDAIVVIGGDQKPLRIQRTVELYKQGFAPLVIISAGTPVLEGIEVLPEAEVMRRQAIAFGLPEDVLLIESKSRSTQENAYFTKQILEDQSIGTILLVTSAYHSRRARRIFKDIMGSEVIIKMQPTKPVHSPLLWVFYPKEAAVIRYEYRNWLRYWMNHFGIYG